MFRFLKKKGPFILSIMLLNGMMQKIEAQKLTEAQEKVFGASEDSLKKLSHDIVFSNFTGQRFRSDSLFIRMLVRALKEKNSFYYPFDSLQGISHLYAPDTSFRIFTWQLKKDEMTFFHRGAIQMRTKDGSLKLIPLHDVSEFAVHPEDSVRSPKNWIGAIYYKIILKTFNGKKFYTLLGYDDYGISSTKKWMEVMSFNADGEPVFGGGHIVYKDPTIKKTIWDRFNIEYKKEASTTFNYNPKLDMIVYDELIPENNDSSKKYTYVPDGEYQGFKWKNGQWVHTDKVFTQGLRLKDGEFPRDQLLLDESGKADENKLLEQSKKNQQKVKKKKAGDN
jgi:hypothetical protein